MTKIKWKTQSNIPFEFWTNVPYENLKRYIGPIYPHDIQNISFRISNPVPIELQEILGRNQDILHLNISEHFYLIEDRIIFVYQPGFPSVMLTQENITHFRIGNNDWQPIENAVFFYQYCIVSLVPKAFSIVGGRNPLILFTNDKDIEESGLTEKPFSDLLTQIVVSNYILAS